MSKLKLVSNNKIYAQPTYKDFLNKTEVLSINVGKDIHRLDDEKNKKRFKKGEKEYGI